MPEICEMLPEGRIGFASHVMSAGPIMMACFRSWFMQNW